MNKFADLARDEFVELYTGGPISAIEDDLNTLFGVKKMNLLKD